MKKPRKLDKLLRSARWLAAASAVAFVVAAPVPAAAADWKLISTAETGTSVYADVSSVRSLPAINVRRPFEVIQIWVKYDYSQNVDMKERSAVSMYRVYCAAESTALISSVAYLPNGKVSGSVSKEDYDFEYTPVTPETLGYAIMEFACGRTSVIGEP